MFKDIASASEELSKTDSRNEKIEIISELLEGAQKRELGMICRMIISRPFPRNSQKSTNLSKKSILGALNGIVDTDKYDEYYSKWGDFGEVVKRLIGEGGPRQSVLKNERNDLASIQRFLDEISSKSGEGSRKERANLIDAKFSQISPLEAKYLAKLLLGSSRHGVSDGLVVHSIAETWEKSVEEVRNAYMLTGDLGRTAVMAKEERLDEVEIEYQRPFLPMLAEVADSPEDVLSEMGYCLCEEKLDGVRIQVHKDTEIEIYTRNLNRATDKFPEVVEELEEIDGRFIVEGELVAERGDRVLPFQRLMKRFRENLDEELIESVPVKPYFFDVLKRGDESFMDLSLRERVEKLESIFEFSQLTRRIRTDEEKAIEEFYRSCLERGNEGIVAKRLGSKYHAGERGKDWLKLKRTGETLDLVITRAEYGHGKRHKWLSDYYLAAYDEDRDEFREIGKTYKGLTDDEIRDMTEKLEEIKIGQSGRTVEVKPRIVAQVDYSNIFSGESSSYDSGYTLRFARIKEIRDDLSPEDADSLERVSKLAKKNS